ncbi:MAG TPA: hypothetical protein VGO13_10790 [Solirubrobacterales bacterium]|nr:hypothetical protein [Solirubrobacterales bacterium]
MRLDTAAARGALRARGAELAGKPVGIFNLERTSATAIRGLAEWAFVDPAKSREECFALMEATLRSPGNIVVEVLETNCEVVPAP